MTCGLSQGLQDISSAFTSVKDKLNEKISAGLDVPSAGKGIGANISTMKADMDTAMADLKAKLDVVIPEVSAQLPNLQTAAEEAAAKLKAAAAEINPARVAELQAEAATKLDEIRSKWGSVNTPGVNIEQVISDVNDKFATMDFCTECPNVDLVDTGDVDPGTGIPIYDTVKKGITAEQPTEDSIKPKDPVDKKKEEEVVPAKTPAGDDSTPIKTEKESANPKPEVEVVPQAPAPTPITKIYGAGPSIESEERLVNARLEVESIFVPDRLGHTGITYWRPQNYMTQIQYEKFFTEYVHMKKRSLSALYRANLRKLETEPTNARRKKIVQKFKDRLEKVQEVKVLPYTGGTGLGKTYKPIEFVPGYSKPEVWTLTDCPKVLNDNTGHIKSIGKPIGHFGHAYVTSGDAQFSKPRPVWDQENKVWNWNPKEEDGNYQEQSKS